MPATSLESSRLSIVRFGLLLLVLFMSLGWSGLAQVGAQEQAIIRSLAWSPDGTLLASGAENGKVSLWDAKGTLVKQFSIQQGRIIRILWSPNNQFFLSWSTDNKAILWATDGTLLAVFQECNWLNASAIQWSPDGEWLAVSPDNTILQIWRTTAENTGILRAALGVEEAGHDTDLQLAWSSDSTMLAAGNTQTNTIYLWDRQKAVYWAITREGADVNNALTVVEDANLTNRPVVQRLAWSPDSQILAIGYFGWTLQLWSRDKALQTLTSYSSEIDGQYYNVELAWSPDGKLLAFGDRPTDTVSTRIWSPDGALVGSVAGGEGVIVGLAWSSTQVLAIAQVGNPNLMLWSVDGDAHSAQPTFDGFAQDAPRWSFDGAYLAMRYNTVDKGGIIQIWMADGTPVTTLNDGTTDANQPFDWSPTSNVIAVRGEGNQVRLIDVAQQ
jgi:WD40 repeat protein